MNPYWVDGDSGILYNGSSEEVLPQIESGTVQCCVTSPPYWGLRDYGHADQIGLEKTPEEYVAKLVEVFREVRRVLRDDGTLWLNLGDSYAGSNGNGSVAQTVGQTKFVKFDSPSSGKVKGLKPKDLCGIPWRVAFALQADGWWLRQDIIWHKPNPMPESVTDRCTKAHEYIFLLTKSARYYYDAEAIEELATGYDGRKDTKYKGGPKDVSITGHERWRYKNLQEDGQQPNSFHVARANGEKDKVYPVRNKRSVWTITTKPYAEAHFATFPPEIPEVCIKAGSKVGNVILDPFFGAGTTGMTAKLLKRKWIGIELSDKYCDLIVRRLNPPMPLFEKICEHSQMAEVV